MKRSKLKYLLMAMTCLVPFANAADTILYEATNAPNAEIDANNEFDAWTVTGVGGDSRCYLKGAQDGDQNLWAIWDLDGEGGTYATHTFAGGPLNIGQSVSLDWAHHVNVDTAIGIRLLDGENTEVEFNFIGGDQYYSRFDTTSNTHVLTNKRYDNYDLFRVTFTLTGDNSYEMSVTTGSIPDNGYNGTEDGNAAPGDIADLWTGTFTGSQIDGFQIYTEGGNESDQWFDNLNINYDWLLLPTNASPYNKEKDVLIADAELSWTVAREISGSTFVVDPNLVSYELYMSESEPNFIDVTPAAIDQWNSSTLKASYTPSFTLNKNSSYFWRVDTILDDNTVATGNVWQFDTELTKAVITSNPTIQNVDAGDTAEFTIEVDSDTPALYQWYKYVDGVEDAAVVNGTNATLYIENAQISDEGLYYCIVNNDSGIAVTSSSAIMSIKRKLAHWTFEDDSIQSVIENSPETFVQGAPTFVTDGYSGTALEIAEDLDMLFTDPDNASYFDICDYGITVGCWVKSTNTQGWVPFVARSGEGNGWQLRRNGYTADRPCFTTRGTGNDDGTSANRGVYDDQWHYVVGTFDGVVKKVYIDGTLSVLYSSDDGSVTFTGDAVTSPINASQSPVAIGGRVRVVDGEYIYELENNCPGLYDEIEIYNYALDENEIAQIYANVSGESVCLSQKYDLGTDCIVNLEDLAALSSEWLNDSKIIPSQD